MLHVVDISTAVINQKCPAIKFGGKCFLACIFRQLTRIFHWYWSKLTLLPGNTSWGLWMACEEVTTFVDIEVEVPCQVCLASWQAARRGAKQLSAPADLSKSLQRCHFAADNWNPMCPSRLYHNRSSCCTPVLIWLVWSTTDGCACR